MIVIVRRPVLLAVVLLQLEAAVSVITVVLLVWLISLIFQGQETPKVSATFSQPSTRLGFRVTASLSSLPYRWVPHLGTAEEKAGAYMP